MAKFFRLFAILAIGFVCLPAANAADAVLEEARRLMAKPDAKAAFELLVALETQRAGDPEFDYLLGIAALDSGRATQAIFALERVLAVNPAHARARAEIARAYFLVGETAAAKREFESVKDQQVPPAVAATIDRFLDAINRLADTDRTHIAGYIEATVGRDTNVNSGPGVSQVAIPLFGGAFTTLNASGRKTSDNFGSIAGGASLRHPLTTDLALLAGLNVSKRVNATQDTFDVGYIDGNVGLGLTRGDDIFTVAFQGNNFYVDNNRYRDAYGLIGQWQRNLNARNQVSAFGQYTELRYGDQPGIQNSIRDANRSVAGLAYAHAYSGGGPTVYLGVYFGSEDQREATRPDLGHRLQGARIGSQYSISEDTYAFVNSSVEHRNYGGQDPIFLISRTDTQYNLSLGLSYAPAKDWKITPQVILTRNNSNIAINEYNRELYSVTVRREF
jgi:tetratricopeptide (TPR) repeat protein